MRKIFHCQGWRRTKHYKLLSSNPEKYESEHVIICPKCPICKLQVIETYWTPAGGGHASAQERVSQADHGKWLDRIKKDRTVDTPSRFLGEWTALAKRDPAKAHKALLSRPTFTRAVLDNPKI